MPSSACDWSSDVCSSDRSEEHTSELQSRSDLVCRLLLEKKKKRMLSSRKGQRYSYMYLSETCFLYCWMSVDMCWEMWTLVQFAPCNRGLSVWDLCIARSY